MKSVRLGRAHYIKDSKSGFWVAQHETDPQSSTLIEAELLYLVQDEIDSLKKDIEYLKGMLEYIKTEE